MPSPAALLLRVLLSLSLIFNGTAYAMSSLQDQQMHSTAAADMHAGCHEHAATTAHQASHADQPAQGHPAPDCCKTGKCVCTSQPTVPAVATLVLHETAIDRIDAQPLVSGHVAPALASLIRPPIA